MPPVVRLRLWPAPSVTVFAAVSDNALAMTSPELASAPPLVAVVVIAALDRASVEPLSVKVDVWPAEPLLVKDIAMVLIVPMLFVPVVCVVPPKTRPQLFDVVGSVLQLDASDQFPLPPRPDHVVVVGGAAAA